MKMFGHCKHCQGDGNDGGFFASECPEENDGTFHATACPERGMCDGKLEVD